MGGKKKKKKKRKKVVSQTLASLRRAIVHKCLREREREREIEKRKKRRRTKRTNQVIVSPRQSCRDDRMTGCHDGMMTGSMTVFWSSGGGMRQGEQGTGSLVLSPNKPPHGSRTPDGFIEFLRAGRVYR